MGSAKRKEKSKRSLGDAERSSVRRKSREKHCEEEKQREPCAEDCIGQSKASLG